MQVRATLQRLIVLLGASVVAAPGTAQSRTARTTAEENAMLTNAFAQLAPGLRPGTAGVCIALLSNRDRTEVPDTGLVAALASIRPVVAANACPRTYASMFVRVDSLGRPVDPPPPPGYVDPTSLTFGRPQFDATDHAYIYVREGQGMSGRDFLCTAGGDKGRVVRCQQVSTWVH